jgi:hypothetical protein
MSAGPYDGPVYDWHCSVLVGWSAGRYVELFVLLLA